MDEVLVSIFASTDVGMQRAGNEDSFLVSGLNTGEADPGSEMRPHELGERGSMMVVSDGMGGAVAGEIASELAVKTIREALCDLPLELSLDERLVKATELANTRIWEHAQENPELSGMGATVTAVLVHSGRAYIAQVGDSRAYLVRGDQIKQLTKDQSLAQMLLDSGAIRPEQAASVPQNVIMQALGTQPTVNVVLTSVELCRDDCLLLCSDGLSNKIDAHEMYQAVRESPDLQAACKSLIETANERGGEDNITVIIARLEGDGLPGAVGHSSITGSLKVINPRVETEDGPTIARQFVPFFNPAAAEEAHSAPGDQPDSSPAEESVEVLAETTLKEPAATWSTTSPHKEKNYTLILIMALVSLLLLGTAAFFFYKLYLQPRLEDRQQIETPIG
ncbi:MAG TPA: Stp1/IreP family PP2C-type Ser/Thr phosphatase [Blastocatellia bacterium]|nr:Stp1/IreP family PP2C-type Ser/Thr phosphatase [Blastocatellia bacterium]